jgi:hypothetical protein
MVKIIKNSIFLFLTIFTVSVSDIYAHPAWGIVVDSRKQVFFTDLEAVWKIDSQEKLSIFKAGVSGTHVHDLSIDSKILFTAGTIVTCRKRRSIYAQFGKYLHKENLPRLFL